MTKTLLIAVLMTFIAACGDKPLTSAEIDAVNIKQASANSVMSKTNASKVAKEWAKEVKAKYGTLKPIAQTDSSINKDCLNGDMLATVEFIQKSGETLVAQCGTTERFQTCLPNDVFESKPQGQWKKDAAEGNCPSSDLPAKMPKL